MIGVGVGGGACKGGVVTFTCKHPPDVRSALTFLGMMRLHDTGPFVRPSVRPSVGSAKRKKWNFEVFFSVFFAAGLDGRRRERRLSSNEDGRVA